METTMTDLTPSGRENEAKTIEPALMEVKRMIEECAGVMKAQRFEIECLKREKVALGAAMFRKTGLYPLIDRDGTVTFEAR